MTHNLVTRLASFFVPFKIDETRQLDDILSSRRVGESLVNN